MEINKTQDPERLINKNGNQNNEKINAKILESSEENIKICADYLRNGGIVGMPTETVYGLAANAFNIPAVHKIFEYKGRPLSDPLIVHITNIPMAKELVNFDEKSLYIFEKLTSKFWPGPLTIVLKANFDKISHILTANTDFIGLRFPKNEIAKKLIEYSGVPIAAPSANKFCHVSPVNPHHVFEDFKEFPVYILDGGVSNYCMESTVIKIIIDNGNSEINGADAVEKQLNKIQILRMGAISKVQLEHFLEEIYLEDKNIFDKNEESNGINLKMERFIVEYLKKEKATPSEKEIKKEQEVIQKEIANGSNIEEILHEDFKINQEAPGQFIKHYSPNVDTYILEFEKNESNLNLILNEDEFEHCVVLDYRGIIKNKFAERKFMKVLDLSATGEHVEVMQNLYNFLRLAEKEKNPKYLLLCDIDKYMEDNPDKLTLVDRISKASSNRKIYYIEKK